MHNTNSDLPAAVQRYLRAIRRRLLLPEGIRGCVMGNVATGIRRRWKAGETYEQIMAGMGSPRQVAAVLNREMQEFTYRRSPWRWALLALAVLAVVWVAVLAALSSGVSLAVPSAPDAGILGGADGPTAIFIATSPLQWADLLLPGLLAAVGLAGFYMLSHCKRKPPKGEGK